MTHAFVMFVLLIANPTGTPRPVTFTQEFTTEQKCKDAIEKIRTSSSNSRIDMAICTPR